ncbi:hypothetical protein P4I53_13945 [Escherichia coli]|uniref:hypothetical protein n=1 Tax=Escherichia coli TaxID=562 RepID=UPI003CE99BC5
MAELTFPLVHGLRTGKGTTDEMLHKDVTLRELTSRDVIESQLASERVVIGDIDNVMTPLLSERARELECVLTKYRLGGTAYEYFYSSGDN